MRLGAVAGVLLGLAAAGAAAAQTSPIGDWLTEGGEARVRIAPCAGDSGRLCGAIVWIGRPLNDEGRPWRDGNNPDPALRTRPILGLTLLEGFRPDGAGGWTDGTVYDPKVGRRYRAEMTLTAPDRLRVSGCWLIFCRGQDWRRHGD